MRLHHEVLPRFQRPAEPGWFRGGHFAGLIAQEIALGHFDAVREIHPGKAGQPILVIEPFSLSGSVDFYKRMMNNPAIIGSKLNRADIMWAFEGDRNYEVSVNIPTASRKGIWFGHLD